MIAKIRLVLALVFVLSLAAPSLARAQDASPVASPAASPVAGGAAHGLNPADLDTSADPADDFFRYANGGWLDRTAIPADEGAYGVFNELDQLTTDQVLGLLGDLAASGDLREGSDEWKAVELFAQGTDLADRNARGIEPIRPLLDEVAAISTPEELHAFQIGAGFRYLTALFYTFVIPDLQDSSVNAPYLSGPFLGLPDRDYYLEDDPSFDAIREAYVATCAALLVHAGYPEVEATAAATAVYDLEKALAEPTLSQEEQQDFANYYNPMTVDELEAAYPAMDWAAYLEALGLTDGGTLIVSEKRYLEALDGILGEADLETVKAWVTLEVMWSFSDTLTEEIERTAFDFQGGVLQGVTEQAPLDERILGDVNGMVGDAVGRLYVARYFPPEAKARIEALVEATIVAFRARLAANPWMSAEAKAVAFEKLDKLAVKVGYPDSWRSYEDVELADSYAGSFLNAQTAVYERDLAKAGQPVDPTEWGALPQEVNAFYDVFNNDITFPAGILQPPFFDYEADAAVNFGAIGFVIGHEITHGFDLQGSQFDADGDLVSWFTEADTAAFQALNDEAVAQYSAVEVLPGVFVDGQLTVTENVADLGGVQVAYDALGVYLAENGDPGEIDGLTQGQRFFLSAATVWRQKVRDEYLGTQVQTDPHSPAEVRATLPIRNMDEFHKAFGIEPGDAMYLAPEDRVVIW